MTYDPIEYQKNKTSYIERQRRYKTRHRELIADRQRQYRKRTPNKQSEYRKRKYDAQMKWLTECKIGKICAWCGFNDWRALQFHHRDPMSKEFSLHRKIGKISIERLKKEAEKCDLICANCHQIYHSPSP